MSRLIFKHIIVLTNGSFIIRTKTESSFTKPSSRAVGLILHPYSQGLRMHNHVVLHAHLFINKHTYIVTSTTGSSDMDSAESSEFSTSSLTVV
jgi:hypothetical protein